MENLDKPLVTVLETTGDPSPKLGTEIELKSGFGMTPNIEDAFNHPVIKVKKVSVRPAVSMPNKLKGEGRPKTQVKAGRTRKKIGAGLKYI